MILISLMLAASTPPAVEPAVVRRREAPRPRPARSKRLIELEATVKSLPLASAGPDRDPGPKGM